MNLAIDFELGPLLKLEKTLLHQRNRKLLIEIERESNIKIDHSCFFRESSLALLKLGVCLKAWRMEDSGAISSFYHFMMKEKGLSWHLLKKSKNKWHLFSIWQEFKNEDTISTDILLKAVDQYLAELEEMRINRFNFYYSDFIKF